MNSGSGMSGLLNLLSERRRRQAGDDVVRFFHWADFDRTEICVAKVGQDTMLQQKVRESFGGFMKRAAAVARARQYPFVWIENMHVDEGSPQHSSSLKSRAT